MRTMTTARLQPRRWTRVAAAVGVAALIGTGLAATTAGADVDLGPDTTNVAVTGTTVTATVTPSIAGYTVIGAEYFIDTVGPDGTGTAMNVSGSTATGTLPTLAIGSTHIIYVHGEDNAFGTSGVWGPTASTTFTVGTTTVGTDLGDIAVTLNADGSYTSTWQPTDPCTPGDPCKLYASVKTKPVTTTLGFTRFSLAVTAGQLNFDTKIWPTDPCAPTDPCRSRTLVTTLVATNGIKYKATLNGLVTTFIPGNPV